MLPLLAGLLAGCASDLGVASYGIVVQNKFYPDDCAQVLAKTAYAEARIKQLQELSQKARQDAGGGIIATTVYGPELAAANGDLRLLRQARIDKKCDEPAPPAR